MASLRSASAREVATRAIPAPRHLNLVPAYVWFVAPALLAYAALFLYPTVEAFWLSLFNWSGMGNTMAFVGLSNFVDIAQGSDFFRAAAHNLEMYAVIFVLQNTVSLAIAMMLTRPSRFVHFYRAIIFLPVVTSSIAVGFIWDTMLNPEIGIVNPLLHDVGLGFLRSTWLANQNLALPLVILIQFWQWNGIAVVLYLAGLQGVPDELRQAAWIDGAGAWQTFRHVTFPLLAPAFTIVTVLSFILIFRAFDLIFVLGGPTGAPDGATSVLGTLIYADAFGVGGARGGSMHLSYAIAEGAAVFLIVGAVSGLLIWFLGRREQALQQ